MSAQDHYDMVYEEGCSGYSPPQFMDGFGQPGFQGCGAPCGGMPMPPQAPQGGGFCGPPQCSAFESFPVGQEAVFEFVGNLRRQAMSMGFQAAMSNCQREGAFLAGFAVFCHPASDRRELQMLVEAAGGQWLENAPDSSFSQAVPTLVFCQLPEANFQQQWQGGFAGFVKQDAGYGGDWGGKSSGSRGQGQKSWSSTSPYVDSYLQPADASNYSAAGLLLWRKGQAGVELLLPLERPWNSFTNDYDPLAWNVIGAKKSGWEHSPRETAVRCLMEVLGGIPEAPRERDLLQMCKRSVAVWYPRGKFALFLHEVKGGESEAWDNPGLSDRFKDGKGRPRSDRYAQQVKYPKEIDDFEWVPGKDLLASKTRQPLTDLLEGFTRIGGFQAFLNHGSLPPVLEDYNSWAAEEDTGHQQWGGRGGGAGAGAGQRQAGQWGGDQWSSHADGSKGKRAKGGWDHGGAGDGWQGAAYGSGHQPWRQGDWGKGKGGNADSGQGKGDAGFGKGEGKAGRSKGGGHDGATKGAAKGSGADKGSHDFEGKGGRDGKAKGDHKGDEGVPKGSKWSDAAGDGKGSRQKGAPKGDKAPDDGLAAKGGKCASGAPAQPAATPAPSAAESPEDHKQSIGERLYVLVQGLVQTGKAQVPPFLVAQKITGMLLELPEPELLILLDRGPKGKAELEERVKEATEILQDQGFV